LVEFRAKTEADDKGNQYNPSGQSNEEGFQSLDPFVFFDLPRPRIFITQFF
jgi:hypothetical protein